MKVIIQIIALSLFGCSSMGTDDLILGKPLPSNAKVISSGKVMVLRDASDGYFGKEINYKGINYLITEDKNGLIDFIRTFDSSFVTPENTKVNMPYSKVKNMKSQEFYVTGYGYEVKLKSGWSAVFMDSYILANGLITDTCKIKSFIKSR